MIVLGEIVSSEDNVSRLIRRHLDQFNKRHALINAPLRSRRHENTLRTRTGSEGNDCVGGTTRRE